MIFATVTNIIALTIVIIIIIIIIISLLLLYIIIIYYYGSNMSIIIIIIIYYCELGELLVMAFLSSRGPRLSVACSWSLLLLHNTVAGEMRAGRLVSF